MTISRAKKYSSQTQVSDIEARLAILSSDKCTRWHETPQSAHADRDYFSDPSSSHHFFLSPFGRQRTYSRMAPMMYDEPDEIDDLLNRAANGDRQALNRLFDVYRSRLKKMVRLRLNRRLQGRDANQTPGGAE
jgi:hypothetical protein